MNPPISNAAVPMTEKTTPIAIFAVVDKPPDEVLEELAGAEVDVMTLVLEGDDELVELETSQPYISRRAVRRCT